MTRTLDLDTLTLKSGAHSNLAEGTCVMEAVAYIAGEKWTDHPQCASPVIAAFLRSWNDSLADDDRQQLKAYIPRLLDSRGTPEQEERRSWMALDWLARAQAATWLRLAKLDTHADAITALPELIDPATCKAAQPTLAAAGAAAGAAARAAALAAAGAAARAAAGAAAGDAALAAAGAAALAAAGAAALAAALAAAGAAAGAAALAAAGAAAGAAALAAAGAAARDALAPTVTTLQASAHELLDRMLAVTGN